MVEKETDNDEIGRVLNTLRSVSTKVNLTERIKRKLSEETKSWSEHNRNALRDIGIIGVTPDSPRTPSEVKVSYLPSFKVAEVRTVEEQDRTTLTSGTFENYISQIRSYVADLEHKVEQSNQVLDKLKEDIFSLENKNLMAERNLQELKQLVSDLTRENTILKEQNQAFTDKLAEMQALLNENETKYERDKHQLLDMNDRESRFLVDELKNKLRKRLKIEHVDFREVEFEEMTLALGENFRMQLNTIFSILRDEGISFDGGAKK